MIHVLTKQIDKAIRQFPWMDFKVAGYSDSTLIIQGGISLFQRPDLEIKFSDVEHISIPTSWKTGTREVSFRHFDPKLEYELNIRNGVLEGNYLFQFIVEDLPESGQHFVAAGDVTFAVYSNRSTDAL